MRTARAFLVAALSVLGAACGPNAEPVTPTAPSHAGAETRGPAKAAPIEHSDELVAQMVKRVAALRGLPVKRAVTSKTIGRDAIVAKIRKHVEDEIPKDVVLAEGESLVAFELVPPEYDFIEGMYEMLQGRLAGFYEPAEQTMYLLDDLDEREARETLAHELVHALQDQSFSLGPMLKFRPGQSDKSSAVHALVEGDATSAMFDEVAGSAFNVDANALRQVLVASTALSSTQTPRVLQESLIAPYADGFEFVQARRKKGGWPLVNEAYKRPPETTEQLLHPEKYDAREPRIPVAPLPVDALGASFKAVLDDDMGEQSLKIILSQWTHGAAAKEAAAGWGGDRFVLARAEDASKRPTFAMALRVTFDTAKDAAEMAAVLQGKFAPCRERAALGPMAWKLKGKDVAIAGGPYVREGKRTTSAGNCDVARRWLDAILR